MESNVKSEVIKIIQSMLTRIQSLASTAIAIEQSHAFSTGTTVALTSTFQTVASVTITPKTTGKFRVIAAGSVATTSTLEAAVSFQIISQTTTGAAASTVQAAPAIEVPGTSTVGDANPNVQWALLTDTSSGLAQPVGVAGVIGVQASVTSGATNLLTVLAGSQLSVQEIL